MSPPGDDRTWGERAREHARRHGLLYFGDVREEVARQLADASPDARRAFALACAERAMAWHRRLPPEDQRPFTVGWRPILDAIRASLLGDRRAASTVRAALDAFHAGALDHADGPDGPDDADEDAAAAAIYAAECFMSGAVDDAAWAAGRIVDIRLNRAARDLRTGDPGPDGLARENGHPSVQAELKRQLDDLAALRRGDLRSVLLDDRAD
jgi:hypothetical protein